MDKEGRPTAGIQMEVPSELDETFRLLHRFGTRLRARHGAGTKRHIKFDDFGRSLYANIKLPGDSTWTRVTPTMAREDLGASLREENACTQKRLATKLIPGPRERLNRPMDDVGLALPARPSRFEIMCVDGVIGKVARKAVIFVVYIPPTMKAGELEELKEALAVKVGAAMKSFKDPLVLITGDFNHRDIGGALNEVGDFVPLATGPTRGANTIDIIYTNAHLAHKETRVLPPLEAGSGAPRDHRCVFTEALFPPEWNFQWISKLRRTRDLAREEAFARDMCEWDWSGLDFSGDIDEMAGRLEKVIEELTDKHFPLERVRKRSNESLWITKCVRRLWKRKI